MEDCPQWMLKKKAEDKIFEVVPFLVALKKILEELPIEDQSLNHVDNALMYAPEEFKEKEDKEETILINLLYNKKGLNKELLKTYENALALDCEMVGAGENGSITLLARVSIVDYYGNVILDTFVQPKESVTDYRTWVSGIKEKDLINAPHFEQVRQQVMELIQNKILVGHSISSDLKSLKIEHPQILIKNVSRLPGVKKVARGGYSLKKLCYNLLGIKIQAGSHSSVVDALATMAVYRKLIHLEQELTILVAKAKANEVKPNNDDLKSEAIIAN